MKFLEKIITLIFKELRKLLKKVINLFGLYIINDIYLYYQNQTNNLNLAATVIRQELKWQLSEK